MSINMDSANTVEFGRLGEKIAADYMTKCLGWNVIDKNVRTRFGEIDIVAKNGAIYVFVEVKLRRQHVYGTGMEAITDFKLAKLVQQIDYYLARHHLIPERIAVRLDAISLLWMNGMVQSVEHVHII